VIFGIIQTIAYQETFFHHKAHIIKGDGKRPALQLISQATDLDLPTADTHRYSRVTSITSDGEDVLASEGKFHILT
jgi:hypothetical protein